MLLLLDEVVKLRVVLQQRLLAGEAGGDVRHGGRLVRLLWPLGALASPTLFAMMAAEQRHSSEAEQVLREKREAEEVASLLAAAAALLAAVLAPGSCEVRCVIA